MSSFTLSLPNKFPEDTEVGAYPASNWPTPGEPSGAPLGEAADEGTVESGSLEFTELEADVAYWAVAEVGEDEYRYVSFFTGTPLASGGGLSVEGLLEALEENDTDARAALGLGNAALATIAVDVPALNDSRIESWNSLGIGWVFHGSVAETARPDVAHVFWVGTVFPKKSDSEEDVWFNPTGVEVEE